YLTIMDLGRIRLIGRCGMLKIALRKKWAVMLGGATIRFRRPLPPFRKYLLKTRLMAWDDKWFYIRQTFELPDGTVAATALVRGLFRARGRSIPPVEALQALPGGGPSPSPPLPPEAALLDMEKTV
ncbi:MAG: thioesterase family protein, partial [Pseudomonadota bacterium]|nr:thioesterase family protein [Pseudomonadota bacterium]